MHRLNTVYFSTRKQWRKWLQKHFEKEKEIWLTFPNKASGKKRISYNDAVEEALCFGWIDSQTKKLDKDNQIQKFSPRRKGSSWSQSNKERLKWLNDEGLLHKKVKEQVKDLLKEKFTFPKDIVAAVKKNKEAWKHFQKFSPGYKRIRVAYIDGARKRKDEFKKRLKNFIEQTEKGKIIKGHGGIEKYY
jgi:uncharacterized protein YdeI (YjbR/CyaY-like superfamily)